MGTSRCHLPMGAWRCGRASAPPNSRRTGGTCIFEVMIQIPPLPPLFPFPFPFPSILCFAVALWATETNLHLAFPPIFSFFLLQPPRWQKKPSFPPLPSPLLPLNSPPLSSPPSLLHISPHYGWSMDGWNHFEAVIPVGMGRSTAAPRQ